MQDRAPVARRTSVAPTLAIIVYMKARILILLAVVSVAGLAGPAIGKQLWAKSYLDQKAPALVVEKWLTAEPDTKGKFVLIDFWATWCGPCREAIPELNAIQKQFGDKIAVIGISDETAEKVKAMKEPRIDYAVAIDSQHRMKSQLEVTGISHVILVDPAGIVRWEGFPLLDSDPLTPEVVGATIAKYSSRPTAP